jgi:FkbM family methyltransferase
MKSPLKRAFLGLFEAVAPAPRLRLTNAVRERLVANPLTIVDVGAVFGPDKRWIQLGPRTCRFITFEPDKRSQAELSEGGPFTILALPTAIGGEAGERILHLTKGEFASSLYPPNRAVLGAFATWSWHESIGTQPVTVDTLDGVLNNHPDWRPDFIKTDIEGADLEALLGGEQAVARALGVQVEAAFIERNIGAPLFSDIDQHLRERGFTLFQLIREHWLRRNGVRGVGSRPQLIWADVVYFRDAPGFIGRLAKASDPEVLLVKFIALLLVYGHFDYATEIVALAAAKEHCPPPARRRSSPKHRSVGQYPGIRAARGAYHPVRGRSPNCCAAIRRRSARTGAPVLRAPSGATVSPSLSREHAFWIRTQLYPRPAMTSAAQPLAGKRMLVVEEALKSESGHWFEYVRSVRELNRAAGAETVVITHREASAAVVTALDAHAIFPWTSWDNIYFHPRPCVRYFGIVRHNWRLYRLMSRFVREHGPFDVLFAPTVVIHHVIGWRLLSMRQSRRIGSMVLLFRNNAGTYAADSGVPVFKRSTNVLKWALRSFRPLIGQGRARLVTDSAKLALEYRHLCGIAPDVLPSPRISPPPALGHDTRAPDAPVVLSCLGPARFEKGIDVMQAAICLYLAENPDSRAQFVIQWNEPIVDEMGNPYVPDPALVADPRVTIIDRALTSAAYDAAIAASDCMLLPYRRTSYFARISGVAVEAVTAGVPLIYTRDTWVEDLVHEVGIGIGVADGDIAGLALAIRMMVSDYRDYRARARERAELARRSHSPDHFTESLWELA